MKELLAFCKDQKVEIHMEYDQDLKQFIIHMNRGIFKTSRIISIELVIGASSNNFESVAITELNHMVYDINKAEKEYKERMKDDQN